MYSTGETLSWCEVSVLLFFHLSKLTSSLCNEQKQKHLSAVKQVFLMLLLNNHHLCNALINFISSAFCRVACSC